MDCVLLALTLCASSWLPHSYAPVVAEVQLGPAYVQASALDAEDPELRAEAGLRWRGLSVAVAVPELEGDPWQEAPRAEAFVGWRADF